MRVLSIARLKISLICGRLLEAAVTGTKVKKHSSFETATDLISLSSFRKSGGTAHVSSAAVHATEVHAAPPSSAHSTGLLERCARHGQFARSAQVLMKDSLVWFDIYISRLTAFGF